MHHPDAKSRRGNVEGCLKFESKLFQLVMAGLVPAIHVLLRNGLKEIIPSRIACDNQSDLPGTRPMLDVVLARDRILDGRELFKVDEPLQSVSLREASDESGAMFEYAAHKIICDADIENANRFVG
jgi:hypothetical protein